MAKLFVNQRLLDLRAEHLEKMDRLYCQPMDDTDEAMALASLNFHTFQDVIGVGQCDDYLLGKSEKIWTKYMEKLSKETHLNKVKNCRELVGLCRRGLEDSDIPDELRRAYEAELLSGIKEIEGL